MLRILLALLLVGCGTIEQQVVEKEKIVEKEVPVPFYIDKSKVDAKLLPHIMEFAGYCEKFEISTKCKENFKKIESIQIVKSFDQKNVVGKCWISSKERWIEILDWQDTDSFLTKAIVMHEAAHCLLGDPFPHYDERPDIMNSVLIDRKTIFYDWPVLIKTMFQRAGGTLALTNHDGFVTVTQTVMDEAGGFACETRED